MPYTIHTLTGIASEQPEHVVAHPQLGRYLKVVPEGTKSLAQGLFKPGTVDEFEVFNARQEQPKTDVVLASDVIDPLIDNVDADPKKGEGN